MARPIKVVDENLLEKLASKHLSDETIADCLGISTDTLHRRFAEKIAFFKAHNKAKLSEIIWDEALTHRKEYALKMLCQKFLGYAEKTESDVTVKAIQINIDKDDAEA